MSRLLYIGVDPSLNGTGLAAIDADQVVVDIRSITPAPLLRKVAYRGDRLRFIHDKVSAWLEQVAQEGTIVRGVIEEGAFGAKGKLFNLGEASGVVRLALTQAHVEMITATNNEIKKAFVDDAVAPKAIMQKRAEALTGRSLNFDEADAYAMAVYARLWR